MERGIFMVIIMKQEELFWLTVLTLKVEEGMERSEAEDPGCD